MDAGVDRTCNIITFDLEEWYHILDLPCTPHLSGNGKISSHTEKSLQKFLERLDLYHVTCTFFVLGQLAERNPRVITEIRSANHEIASHGYNHELITTQDRDRFGEDIRRSKRILEDITGEAVVGYRGPGFSITADNAWAFEVIAEEGYAYDATVYPGNHGHGGLPGAPNFPFLLTMQDGSKLEEYPVTLFRAGAVKTAFAGGGYFRLFPFSFISFLFRRMNGKKIPVNSYFHARDFDPDVPRVPMPAHRRFKCYVNLKQSYAKLEKILKRYPFCSVRDWRRGRPLPAVPVQSFLARRNDVPFKKGPNEFPGR